MRLHREHGLNPTMTTCFICGGAKDILLVGAASRDFPEECRNTDGSMKRMIGATDMAPCQECEKLMEQGIILISVRDGESGNNPYRTGGWVVVREEMIRRLIKPSGLLEHILRSRMAFLPDETWDAIGLPRGNQEGEVA
jgi:hypothetical protein